MESTFLFYFQLGWQHIVDWAALDHILFLCALCAVYTLKDWRRVLLLVTAFTIGHCLTLLLAGTDILRLPADWVEMLIPATIMLTAIYNLSAGVLFKQDNLAPDSSTSVFPCSPAAGLFLRPDFWTHPRTGLLQYLPRDAISWRRTTVGNAAPGLQPRD